MKDNSQLRRLRNSISSRYIGKTEVIDNLLIALLSGGHVLIEDVPGVGKTTLALALADSLGLSFARIQFTPDTLPADVTGFTIYNMQSASFQTSPGPILHQIVLADELNRTSPKTQAALLEAMQEHQVTIDGKTFPIPEPFMVIATENPMDFAGTWPLPEAQLDRFLMNLTLGYPDSSEADALAERFLSGTFDTPLTAVLTAEELLSMRNEVKAIHISSELIRYANAIAEATRAESSVRYGASPRAALDLMRAARGCAFLDGRDFVIPEDIIAMARVVLPHRLRLTAEAQMNRRRSDGVVETILSTLPVPR